MICRALKCHAEAMPNGLCGLHDEMAEDGTPFDLKRKPGRPAKPATLYPVAERRPMCCVPTKKGTERCHNAAAVGSDMCGLHRRLVELRGVA